MQLLAWALTPLFGWIPLLGLVMVERPDRVGKIPLLQIKKIFSEESMFSNLRAVLKSGFFNLPYCKLANHTFPYECMG